MYCSKIWYHVVKINNNIVINPLCSARNPKCHYSHKAPLHRFTQVIHNQWDICRNLVFVFTWCRRATTTSRKTFTSDWWPADKYTWSRPPSGRGWSYGLWSAADLRRKSTCTSRGTRYAHKPTAWKANATWCPRTFATAWQERGLRTRWTAKKSQPPLPFSSTLWAKDEFRLDIIIYIYIKLSYS